MTNLFAELLSQLDVLMLHVSAHRPMLHKGNAFHDCGLSNDYLLLKFLFSEIVTRECVIMNLNGVFKKILAMSNFKGHLTIYFLK